MTYDSILVLSFGGPEAPDDVVPFLENVLRGKNVPRERMLQVADHYYHFGGVSPINAQNRALIAALRNELAARGPDLPIYWGNRNWHPFLADALRQMCEDGLKHALVFVTSAMSSYSGCRQYLEDIERARAEVGEGAPQCDKLRAFYNHPGFIEASTARLADALAELPDDRRSAAHIIFTAHSIPTAMAAGCPYVEQLEEASRLVMGAFPVNTSRLVYQSRSGPPSQPWLEPDIGDYLREVAAAGKSADVVVVPIGFISDHMEVLYDLDTQARDVCQELGLNMVRAGTVGTHPAFVSMIRELIAERVLGTEKLAIGNFGPRADVCPVDCCPCGRSGGLRPPAPLKE